MNPSFYPSVTRPYKSWLDEKLSIETLKFQLAITGNPIFVATTPDMPTYGTAVQDFRTKLANAGTKDVNAIAAKNTSRRFLIGLSVTLGNSVTDIANGDLDALMSTLMPLRKLRQPSVLGVTVNLRVINGLNSGELIARVNTQRACKSYEFEYMPVGGTDWASVTVSTSKFTIGGLVSGTKYYFRVTMIGSKGQSVTSGQVLSPYA